MEHSSSLVDAVLRQTEYTEDEAKIKLAEHGNVVENVVRDFYGLLTKKQEIPLKTCNQEIYRQIRKQLQNISTNVAIDEKGIQ